MNNKQGVVPIIKSPKDYEVYRINSDESNRLAIIFDSTNAHTSLTYCLQIFDVGGQTPLNCHQQAVEMFFVFKGEGIAICDGKSVTIKTGDSLLIPPRGRHLIRNTGSSRLYTLTLMVPNDNFSQLIRGGTPAELDGEDLAVLERIYS